MGRKSVRRSSAAHSDQPLIDYAGMQGSLTRHTDPKVAANHIQLPEERQVNPLWMITVALAVLFGTLLMFA